MKYSDTVRFALVFIAFLLFQSSAHSGNGQGKAEKAYYQYIEHAASLNCKEHDYEKRESYGSYRAVLFSLHFREVCSNRAKGDKDKQIPSPQNKVCKRKQAMEEIVQVERHKRALWVEKLCWDQRIIYLSHNEQKCKLSCPEQKECKYIIEELNKKNRAM